jgi:hypothetical protein
MNANTYNFVTVANSSYAVFLQLFIASLLDIVDQHLIEHVYVFDTGLDDITRQRVSRVGHVILMPTSIRSEMKSLHDSGWQASTYFKTHALQQILDTASAPTILLDCDTIILRDFIYLLDGDYDVGVCRTDQSEITQYLGAFFVANNTAQARVFVRKWIDEMKAIDDLPKESPALVRAVKNSKGVKVREFLESQICSLAPHANAHIYHLKSGGPKRTVEGRLHQSHVEPLLKRYGG